MAGILGQHNMKHVLFDMDGTLVTPHCRESALQEIASKVAQLAGLEQQEIYQQMIDVWHHERSIIKKYNWDAHIKKVQKKFQVRQPFSYVRYINKHLKEARIYPDVLPTLDFLSKRGYHLYLVTNGYKQYQIPILKKVKLLKYFEKLYTPYDNIAKPNIKIFKNEINGCDVALCVDDQLYQGVYLGKKLHAKTCLIARSYHHQPPLKFLKAKVKEEMQEQSIAVSMQQLKPNYIVNDLRKIKQILK